MAKFTSGELRLKDDQRITFGTGLDSNMWWDGAELRLDTTISGVDPTQPYHLTTRWYVDQAVTSGAVASGTLPHHNLTAFDAYDDHLQYVPTNADRGFTASVSGVDPTQNYHLTTKWYVDQAVTSGTVASGTLPHNWLTNFDATDDHQQYVPTDANRGFTASVSGVDPTQSYHLTTRFYVDDLVSTVSGDILAEIGNNYISDAEMTVISGDIISYITNTPNVISHGNLDNLGVDDHTQYILVDGSRGFTGTVSGVDPTQSYHLTTKNYVDSVAQGLDWQDSVLDIVPLASGVQVTGNRYIASTTSGSWTQDNIYEWSGTQWNETPVEEGFAAWVEVQDALYVYSNGSWIKFGSTVTHNNLSGLDGGTPGQYYHLTSAEESALTTGGNASTYHIHDDRYFTESEITVISGDIVGQIPTDYISNAEMTVISGDIMSNVSNNYISNSEMTTISGDIINYLTGSGIIDHGDLTGLADDDHPQYVPTNASRGFTNTVSGVTPTQPYHLATKSYVDQGGIDRHGRQSIGNGASYVDVSFADVGSTNYTIGTTLQNTSDSPPSIYAYIVSATTASGFRVTFMGDMDSANYVLNWSVLLD